MSSPEYNVQWGESAVAGDLSDPATERPGGYQDGEDLPHGQFNSLLRNLGRWTSHGFANATAFIAVAEPGQIAPIVFDPSTAEPYAEVANSTKAGAVSVDGDGEYFVAALASTVTLHAKDTPGTTVRTFTPSFAVAFMLRAVTNGQYVLVAHDTRAELFDRDTGASVWTYTHADFATAVLDIAIDGARAYIVGSTGAGNGVLHAVGLSDGVLDWSWDHDAVPNACCTDGAKVYLSGNASGGTGDSAAGSRLVAIDAVAGTLEWERPDKYASGAQRMVSNGEYLWCGSGVLSQLACGNGVLLEEKAGTVSSISMDSDFVYLASSTFVVVYSNAAGWSSATSGVRYSTTSNIVSAYSDGERLWYIEATGTPTVHCARTPVTRTRSWYRADPSDKFLPMRQLAIPKEKQ